MRLGGVLVADSTSGVRGALVSTTSSSRPLLVTFFM
jgi:hypothetical protein